MKSDPENAGLLKEIHVLDLADEKASFCSKLLADLGARVTKIEKPGGDASRNSGPFWKDSPHPERSLSFWFNNAKKLGITLNIEKSAGREILLRLLKKTDILVETSPPGYLSEVGLGFEVLRGINPGIILVSVTGFGQTGPHSMYKSCDLIAAAMGGQMYVTGDPSGPPLKPYDEQTHYTASLFAVISILLALRKRNMTGKGEHIDISLQEAVASTLEHVMIRYFHDHVIAERQGNRYWNNEFCIVPCKDGFMLVTLIQHWETLVAWMDSEGMAADLMDDTWKDEVYRLEHLDHIIEVLKRWTRTHTANELFEIGQLMRFPWAPIQSPKDVLQSPQLKARGLLSPVEHPEIKTRVPYPKLPFGYSSLELKSDRRAPLIGEHNTEVLQGELGLTDKEIEQLRSEGVI
ncbi:MAG TPA: CoA transferase [Desulfatiglandales bacterium]|nr:CoA transferase [Desulfatiglandales bacterium]